MVTAANTTLLDGSSGQALAQMAHAGWQSVATIRNGSSNWDLAFKRNDHQLVLRCVISATQVDYRDLATMLREGDFDHALLVDTGPATKPPLSDIETCTLEQLPEVLARWERSP